MSHIQLQRTALDNLEMGFKKCTACSLCRRPRVVPGRGNPNASIVLVQERLYEEEVRSGRVLSGHHGGLVRDVLASHGVREEDVWITSAVKCPSSDFSAPKVELVKACNPWLMKEISVVKPDVIVCLGTAALKAVLLKHNPSVAHDDGLVFDADIPGMIVNYSVPAVVTHNPMALVRNQDLTTYGSMARFHEHIGRAVGISNDVQGLRSGKTMKEIINE